MVLKDGGRMALFEVVSGPDGGDLRCPVPGALGEWARGELLASSDELRRLADSAGFAV
jgi:hypothetical protein